MVNYFAVNGEVVPKEEATVGITDIGLLRGYGIFDFLPIYRNVPVFLDLYLNRFYSSAAKMRLDIGMDQQQMKNLIYTLIGRNGMDEGFIRLVLTGGCSEDGFTPADPNFFILQHPPIDYPEENYTKGIKLMKVCYRRDYPDIKTTNYLSILKSREALEKAGAMDVLFHYGGEVSESSRSNFFVVDRRGLLKTSDDHILSGITRDLVIADAEKMGIPVQIGPVMVDELPEVKEAFITSTTKGVMPVKDIDEIKVGGGDPGEITKKLIKRYWQRVNEYIEQHRHEPHAAE